MGRSVAGIEQAFFSFLCCAPLQIIGESMKPVAVLSYPWRIALIVSLLSVGETAKKKISGQKKNRERGALQRATQVERGWRKNKI